MAYDPIKLTGETQKFAIKGNKRKYYRISRGGRWYGGIATSDCCGCNLRCIFCWSNKPRDNPEKIGNFYSPEEVFKNLTNCAQKYGYKKIRISGNEPTVAREHLLELLKKAEKTEHLFILETNGTLIDDSYAQALSGFKNLHIRVSIKGTNQEEFSLLTGALAQAFQLQIDALKYLLNYGVRCHPAAMLSFSPKESFLASKGRLKKDPSVLSQELRRGVSLSLSSCERKVKESENFPKIAYEPNRIPDKFV